MIQSYRIHNLDMCSRPGYHNLLRRPKQPTSPQSHLAVAGCIPIRCTLSLRRGAPSRTYQRNPVLKHVRSSISAGQTKNCYAMTSSAIFSANLPTLVPPNFWTIHPMLGFELLWGEVPLTSSCRPFGTVISNKACDWRSSRRKRTRGGYLGGKF